MIRMATFDDGPALAQIYRPYVLKTSVTFEYDPPSGEEMSRRISQFYPRFPYLVYEENGVILGYAYAHPQHERAAYQWSAELSVYAEWSHRGQGIGKALYQPLIRLLERQGYYSLYACITQPNPVSMAMHQKMGFEVAGIFDKAGYKMGEWHGVGWLIKFLRPFNNEAPTAPLLVTNIPKGEMEGILKGDGDLCHFS